MTSNIPERTFRRPDSESKKDEVTITWLLCPKGKECDNKLCSNSHPKGWVLGNNHPQGVKVPIPERTFRRPSNS